MTLMVKQSQTILHPVLYQGLLAMGVNWNMPRAVVHGPWIYQGLNIPNLCSAQMITDIQTPVKFGQHTTDATGVLVRACGKLLWNLASEAHFFRIPTILSLVGHLPGSVSVGYIVSNKASKYGWTSMTFNALEQ